MMKNIAFLICSLWSFVIFAQISTSILNKSNGYLNEKEAEFLNTSFDNTRKDFDFRNKKIGFITGNLGKTKTNKDDYFKSTKSLENKGNLLIFTEQEKTESGGFDAVILYWNKVLQKRKRLIRILKE